ncbi:hypothetical protein OH76DRAFT_884457 [Lentinus brumalis]|uniref:Uncharacterized protein n=1 Tax=Lentinus brumalis TaxID=2498619 RepID=A0A371D1C0_9APHY|nr:hypothetical protein OH76DRAFT_884457 [Polyporus brumalis]
MHEIATRFHEMVNETAFVTSIRSQEHAQLCTGDGSEMTRRGSFATRPRCEALIAAGHCGASVPGQTSDHMAVPLLRCLSQRSRRTPTKCIRAMNATEESVVDYRQASVEEQTTVRYEVSSNASWPVASWVMHALFTDPTWIALRMYAVFAREQQKAAIGIQTETMSCKRATAARLYKSHQDQ